MFFVGEISDLRSGWFGIFMVFLQEGVKVGGVYRYCFFFNIVKMYGWILCGYREYCCWQRKVFCDFFIKFLLRWRVFLVKEIVNILEKELEDREGGGREMVIFFQWQVFEIGEWRMIGFDRRWKI